MAVNRKLVAIVVADVVGYSRLMERDEAGTHERLRTLHNELIAPKIALHGGRTVKTSGDGMLLEFPSATSALRCGVEIQREMGARNLYVPTDQRIEFRIGINLGDIIVEGDDILGNGVNVAARLEALAEPGGICVASAVRDQVQEDLDVEFVDLGEHLVKNISKSIHVLQVVLVTGLGAQGVPPASAPNIRRTGTARWLAAGAVGIVVLAIVIAAAWRILPHPNTPERGAGEAPPHSVMIAPIVGAVSDATLEGAAARLTVELARAVGDSMPDTRVTPAAAAAVIAAKTADARASGVQANVRYLIQGDLLPTGTQVAVTLRLVDTRDGRQIQTERQVFERTALDEHEVLIRRLAYSTRIMLTDAILRAMPKPGEERSAQDFVDRSHAVTITDPVARAVVLGYLGRLDAAFAANDRAHNIDPTRFSPIILRGWLYLSAGKPMEALESVDSMQAALGNMAAEPQSIACAAHVAMGAYDKAIAACERAAASDDSWNIFANMTAAFAMLGEATKASQAKAKLLQVRPDFTIARFEAKKFSSSPEMIERDRTHLLAGLRKAGVPE